MLCAVASLIHAYAFIHPSNCCFHLYRPNSKGEKQESRPEDRALQAAEGANRVVMQMLQDTRALLINGFLFDELLAEVVLHAASTARSAGCAVFFDPGPRAWTLPAAVLHGMLDVADVVVTTQACLSIVSALCLKGMASSILQGTLGCGRYGGRKTGMCFSVELTFA